MNGKSYCAVSIIALCDSDQSDEHSKGHVTVLLRSRAICREAVFDLLAGVDRATGLFNDICRKAAV